MKLIHPGDGFEGEHGSVLEGFAALFEPAEGPLDLREVGLDVVVAGIDRPDHHTGEASVFDSAVEVSLHVEVAFAFAEQGGLDFGEGRKLETHGGGIR